MSLAKEMSLKHEHDLAGLLGGRVQPGSGNQSANPADVVVEHLQTTFDCKATRGNTIGVSREMWEKITDQAQGFRPGLALRWYGDDRLRVVHHDLVVISLNHFTELCELADMF